MTEHDELEELVMGCYTDLFPNYAWTGAQAAMDLMNAEVKTLRMEADDVDKQNTACLEMLRVVLDTRDVHGVPEGIARLSMQFSSTLGCEIAYERGVQDKQWGGNIHDEHDAADWIGFMNKFLNRAAMAAKVILEKEMPNFQFRQISTPYDADPYAGYEDNLIKVAALAVAAIQSSRRKRICRTTSTI